MCVPIASHSTYPDQRVDSNASGPRRFNDVVTTLLVSLSSFHRPRNVLVSRLVADAIKANIASVELVSNVGKLFLQSAKALAL